MSTDEDRDTQNGANFQDDVVFEPTDSENVELGSKQKLRSAKDELAQALSERNEYLTLLQRSRADYVNLQREEEARRKDLRVHIEGSVLSDLFPVLDSFDAAMRNKSAWEAVDANWRVGVEYIHTQLLKVLDEYGITKIDCLGWPFDPHLHDPLEYRESEEGGRDRVIELVQNGYRRGASVLRPAKVIIGK